MNVLLSCFILLLISTTVFAQASVKTCTALFTRSSVNIEEQVLTTLLEEYFNQEWAIEPGNCMQNCYRMIAFAQNKMDLSKAEILIIKGKRLPQPRETMGMFSPVSIDSIALVPLNARSYSRSWRFHAVVALNGKIYDYDFGNSPLAVDAKTYFEKMFGYGTSNQSQPVFVRRLSASGFYKWYHAPNAHELFLPYADNPFEKLTDYLKNLRRKR